MRKIIFLFLMLQSVVSLWADNVCNDWQTCGASSAYYDEKVCYGGKWFGNCFTLRVPNNYNGKRIGLTTTTPHILNTQGMDLVRAGFPTYCEDKIGKISSTIYVKINHKGEYINVRVPKAETWGKNDSQCSSRIEVFTNEDLQKIIESTSFGENGCIDLTFVWVMRADVYAANLNRWGLVVTDTCMVRVYDCESGIAGTITANKNITPLLRVTDGDSVFAVYPTDVVPNVGVPVLVGESPILSTLASVRQNQKSEWYLSNGSDLLIGNPIAYPLSSNRNKSQTYAYTALNPTGFLTPGYEYKVTRINRISGTTYCSTDPVRFRVVAPAVLEGFEEDNLKKYVCEVQGSSSSFGDKEDDYLLIEGNKLNVDGQDVYGIKYEWQYKKSTSGTWITLPECSKSSGDGAVCNYNSEKSSLFSAHHESSPQDLYVIRSMFASGVSYDFRQVVILENFSNREITAENNGIVRVTTYKKIKPSEFKVAGMGTSCADGLTNEVKLGVEFTPSAGIYNYLDHVTDSGLLEYSYSFYGTEGKEQSVGFSKIFNVSESSPKTFVANIQVVDGCENKVELKDELVLEKQPSLDPNYINCSKANVKYSSENKRVEISIPDGIVGILSVNSEDEDYSVSSYLYSENGVDYELMNKRGIEIKLGASAFKTCWLKKKSNSGSMCESNPVEIVINKVGVIVGNKINDDILFVCKGEKNPQIYANPASGGYGTFVYKWIYSDDNVTYYPMTNGENIIETQNLGENKWDLAIEKPYYLKRVAISRQGDGMLSDTSAYVVVKPYSTPKLQVLANNTAACYDEEVELSIKQDEVSLSEIEDMGLSVSYNFGSKKNDEYFNFGKASQYVENTQKISITRDTLVYATIDMCGSTITSLPLRITSGENLSPKVVEGDCKVRGGKVKVTIANTSVGRTYNILQNGVELGGTTAELQIPEVGDVPYKVVVSDAKCTKETDLLIEASRIHERFKQLQLAINNNDETVANVCAGGKGYTIATLGSSVNKNATDFLWYVNGKSVSDAKDVALNYIFPNVGTSYTIVRESREVQNGDVCQWVRDTVRARTFDRVSAGELALNNSGYVCDGEEVTWTLGGLDGGSQTKYGYEVYSGTEKVKSGLVMKDDSESDEISFKNVGINSVHAKVYDNECSDQTLYSAETKKATVVQAAEMNFILSASPSMVAESNKTTSISITATAKNGDVEADAFAYSFTTGSGMPVEDTKEGSPFLLFIDSSYFTNDRLVVNVTRTEANSGCVSTSQVIITQSQGFEDVPTITSNASGETVCGGEEVTFGIEELPTFGTTKLTPADVSYSWYKDGSLIASSATCKVKAVAGDTFGITCKISYKYDEVLKPAYVYAKEVQLIGKSGVKIGNIKEQETASNMINICLGETDRENLTLVVDDIEIGEKDVLEWQQSANGTTWTRVPTVNIDKGDEPIGRTLTVLTEKYASEKGVCYFRLQGTSECGTTTYSKNIITLRVDTLPAAPVVALRSSNVIKGTAASLNFSPKSAYNGFVYKWGTTEEDLNSVETEGGAQAILAGEYKSGMNKIYVQKVAKSGGKCASAVAEYDFRLYDELTIGNLVPGTIDTTDKRCPNNGELELYVVNIKGGSGKYDIAWEYKSEGGSWIAFDAQTTSLPFSAKFAGGSFLDSYQYQLILDKLSATTSFRATVSSTGDYAGESKTTNEFTVNYYEPLKDGGIDNGELLLCYGAVLPNIEGRLPKGGDGEYTYQWLKTASPELENSWKEITSATRPNYTGRDTMMGTTYYKRVLTDGCGTTIESKAKRVEVQTPVMITSEDINYNKAVNDGKAANMWGVRRSATDESQFIWYDSRWIVLDTTEVSEIYTSKGLNAGEDQQTYTFYAKKIDAVSGCLSYNSDTLYVTAYTNTSGVIYVAGTQEENENSFWVCPDNSDVKIMSYKNPEGATYKWYYRVTTNAQSVEPTVGDWNALRQASGALVTAENISMDTMGVASLFKNTTGRAKYIELKRLAMFSISGENAEMESNIVRINVVPTMQSVASLYNVVGTLTSDRTKYCKGEDAAFVSGEVDFASETRTIWNGYSKYFGPWLYDKEYEPAGFSTWFEYKLAGGEYDTADVRRYNEDGYADIFMPGEGISHAMNATYNVRRAVSDGCTSAYTNVLNLYVTDAVGTMDRVQMYGFEEGSVKKIYKGFEIGDSLVVGYNSTDGAECMWALDSLFTNPLEESKSYVGFRMTEDNAIKLMQDAHVYMKRLSNGCWSSTLAIPLALGTASDGGFIGGSQKVCKDSEFGMIASIVPATGDWIAPEYNAMKWTYSWQYSKDSTTWVDIAGSDSIVLTADLVNRYAALMSGNDSYFRRVAKNDSGRVRYSNGVKMSFYEELKPGVVSMDKDMNGFCVDAGFPIVSTTSAIGGRVEDYGVMYKWKVSFDGGDYSTIDFNTNNLNLSFIDTFTTLSRDKNVEVKIICEYTDGEFGCGTVTSEPLKFTLYRFNKAPDIYQDNDSCNAELVTVKVSQEQSKSYYFVSFVESSIGEDSITWKSEATEQTIRRVTNMIADMYGVYSVDEQTGCVSDYTYFNVDSLPGLTQEKLVAPEVVCYGEDFTVKGGEAVGGNGEKSYTWQYSYDNEEWSDLTNGFEPDLEVVNPKTSVYYRRLVKDMCDRDTTESVYINVREKVTVDRDALVLHDNKCSGRTFNVELSDELKRTENDYYMIWTQLESGTWMGSKDRIVTVEGFEGDSLEIRLSHVVVDSLGYVCQEKASIYAHNAIAIDHNRNVIGCDDLTPCNGRMVDVTGEEQSHKRGITYKWYISSDNSKWTEQLLMTDKDLRVEVKDTMFIKRLVYNGCVYDTSNMVTIIGSKIEDYDYVTELGLSVISNMADSTVALYLERGREFEESYYMEGDGQLPLVEGNLTTLPYDVETYKDSLLQIIAISDHCVKSYRVSPLRGGVISFDGEGFLCGGGVLPAIVATDVEGGLGSYTYQWQYKNIYTSDYINIDGANMKEYTPSAVNVETDYRRVTFSGEYVSYSNVVSVNIRPLPKAKDIFVSLSDSVLTSYGLAHNQYSTEKLPAIEMSLKDSISDVDVVLWQKSYDGVAWEDVEKQEASASGLYELYLTDTTEIVYYRTVGTSACGEATSKAFKVTTVYAPVILDEELVLFNNICKGDPYVRLSYKKTYSDVYSYTYRTIDYEGSGVFAWSNSAVVNDLGEDYWQSRVLSRLNDTTKTALGAIFTYPKHSFDVEVTRIVNATGASSTKLVHFTVNDLSATFSYIVDGVELHQSGEPEQSVRLNQGSRVVFTPEVEGGNESLTYKWNLIAPLNTEYYNTYGGSVGREGLTSTLESPACYFYNGGVYTIQMTVSDGMCTAMVRDSALYIDRNTVRSFRHSVSLEEEVDDNYVDFFNEYVYVDIYPTLITDYCMINTNSKKLEHYEIYDANGMKVKEGDFIKTVRIETSALPTGVYVIRVGDKIVKLVK